jgi:hypothetical protein
VGAPGAGATSRRGWCRGWLVRDCYLANGRASLPPGEGSALHRTQRQRRPHNQRFGLAASGPRVRHAGDRRPGSGPVISSSSTCRNRRNGSGGELWSAHIGSEIGPKPGPGGHVSVAVWRLCGLGQSSALARYGRGGAIAQCRQESRQSNPNFLFGIKMDAEHFLLDMSGSHGYVRDGFAMAIFLLRMGVPML